MFDKFEMIWGTAVPFDKPERNLYMVYYGLYIKGIFLGVCLLMNKNAMKKKPRNLRVATAV